jgi:hypothetical protein
VNGPAFNNKNGGGIVFDGINDYGDLSNNIILSNEFTICLWQNLTSGTNSDSLDRRTLLSLSSGTTRIQYGNNVAGILFVDDSLTVATTLTTYKSPGATYALIPGIDFNYTVRRDSSNLTQQFINGSMLENIFGNQGIINGTYTLDRLGMLGNTVRPYYGCIYNILIYNRALSQQEITQNYNATKGRFGL